MFVCSEGFASKLHGVVLPRSLKVFASYTFPNCVGGYSFGAETSVPKYSLTNCPAMSCRSTELSWPPSVQCSVRLHRVVVIPVSNSSGFESWLEYGLSCLKGGKLKKLLILNPPSLQLTAFSVTFWYLPAELKKNLKLR